MLACRGTADLICVACYGVCVVAAGARVTGVSGKSVQLADGSTVTARRGVVVAVEGPEASRILGAALQVEW